MVGPGCVNAVMLAIMPVHKETRNGKVTWRARLPDAPWIAGCATKAEAEDFLNSLQRPAGDSQSEL